MPRPRPVSKLYQGPEKWTFDALKVNNPSRKMTKTSKTLKRISFPRILLLMHYQVRPNPYRHSPRKTKTVVLAEEDPDDKPKARILLPLALTPLLSRRKKTKIRTKKTYPTLSTILVSKKIIMPTNVLRRSQKTSAGLGDFHVGD